MTLQKPRWTANDFQTLLRLWPEQGSEKTALKIGKSAKAVQVMAIRKGLICNQKARYSRMAKAISDGNTSCDSEYFCRDWSPNMAYVLGYIYADGCLQKDLYCLGFLCHSKDEEILLAIHKELKSTHKVIRSPARIYKGRRNGPKTCFNVSSKKLVSSLVKRFGLQPCKSSLDLPVPEIPDEWFGHFLRGYFDGDGSVKIRKNRVGGEISFVGTRKFIKGMRRMVCRLTKSLKTKIQRQINHKTGRSVYVAYWGCHRDLKSIYRLMYPKGDYIFLQRKRSALRVLVRQEVRPMRSVRISQVIIQKEN